MLGRVVKSLCSRGGRCLSTAVVQDTASNRKVSLLGVPFERGQNRPGVRDAVRVLRESGIIQSLEFLDYDVKDCGDIEYEPEGNDCKVENMNQVEHFSACAEKVSRRVESIVKSKSVCLTLGGDHSIAVGTIDGHTKAAGADNICVLYVDAHCDINTNCTSGSGNIHGMSVGLVAKELAEEWPVVSCLSWISRSFSVKNIAYIGLRSIDNCEREICDKFDITRFTMDDVERLGIHNVVDLALRKIDPHNNKSIHVSFDIDALDRLEAPCTGYSIRGGLTLREAMHIMERAHQTGRLAAIDLVEINPSLGDRKEVEMTVEAAKHVIAAGLGHCRRGYNQKGPLW